MSRPAAPRANDPTSRRCRLGVVFLCCSAVFSLVSASANAQTYSAECRIERLTTTPAARNTAGALGNPPEHLNDSEITKTSECLSSALDRALALVRDAAVARTKSWTAMSSGYRASEHGTYLQVFANPQAAGSYALYEDGARMDVGSTIIKRAFRVEIDGRTRPYRIYIMERMPPGYEVKLNDWRFAAYEANGALVGETGGRQNERVRFCAECHQAARTQDFLFFVPPKYRFQ